MARSCSSSSRARARAPTPRTTGSIRTTCRAAISITTSASRYRSGMRHRLALAFVLFASQHAHAGRTHFAWFYGTELVPENGTEVETWIVEENKKGDNNRDETSF